MSKKETKFSFITDIERMKEIDEKVFRVSRHIESGYLINKSQRNYFVPIKLSPKVREILQSEKIDFTEKELDF